MANQEAKVATQRLITTFAEIIAIGTSGSFVFFQLLITTGSLESSDFFVHKKFGMIGGEGLIVGELSCVVCFELEAYPEPKVLSASHLKELRKNVSSDLEVAYKTGLSRSTVQERLMRKTKRP